MPASSSKSGTQGISRALNPQTAVIAAVAVLLFLVISDPAVPSGPTAQEGAAAGDSAAAETTATMAIQRVRQSYEWQKQAVQKHLNVTSAGEFPKAVRSFMSWVTSKCLEYFNMRGAGEVLKAVSSWVTSKCLDDNGDLSMQVLALLVIFCAIGIDLMWCWCCNPTSPPVPNDRLEYYRNAAAKEHREAAAHRAETVAALQHTKTAYQQESQTGQVSEEVVKEAEQASERDHEAETEVNKALDRVNLVEMVESRWESFEAWHVEAAQKQWAQAQDYSLSSDGHLNKMDLKNFLQSPGNKWIFAGTAYTPGNMDELFAKMDTNQDGKISHGEFLDFFLAQPPA